MNAKELLTFGYGQQGIATGQLSRYAWTNWYDVLQDFTPQSISVCFRCIVPGQKIRAGIYEYISESEAGALLCRTDDIDVPEGYDGWMELPIREPRPTLPAGRYHIMENGIGDADSELQPGDTPTEFIFYKGPWTGVPLGVFSWWGIEAMPDPFAVGEPTYSCDSRLSLFCTYTPVGAPPPIPSGNLYFTMEELEIFKILSTQPSHSPLWASISSWATDHINDPPPAMPTGDHSQAAWRAFFDLAKDIRHWLETMAFMYAMTEDTSYAEALKEWMLTTSGWERWGAGRDGGYEWAVTQSSGRIITGFCFGYDVLRNYLTEAERITIRTALINHTQYMYDSVVVSDIRTTSYPNSIFVRACPCGLVALTLGAEASWSPTWLDYAKSQTSIYFNELASPDGVYWEGLHYCGYAMDSVIPFLDALKRVEGTDFFAGNSFLSNQPYTWIYLTYNGMPAQFEDCNWREGLVPDWLFWIYKLAGEYANPHAQWYADTYASKWPLAYIWKNPNLPSTPPDNLPLSRFFDHEGYVVFRTGWGPNDLVLMFKSGTSQGHAHNDQNDFQIYYKGKPIICGAGYVCMTDLDDTWPHNCILVDGLGQCQEPGDFQSAPLGTRGKVISVEEVERNYRYILGDASAVYTGWSGTIHGRTYEVGLLNKCLRHMVFVENPNYFVIFDQLEATTAKQFTSVLNMPRLPGAMPTISVGDDLVTLNQQGIQLRVMVIEPEGFTHEIIPYTDPWGPTNQIRVITPTPVETAEFLTVLYPDAVLPMEEVKINNLLGVIISYGRYKDLVLFNSDGNPVDEYVELGGYYEAIDGEAYAFEDTGVRTQFDTYQVIRLQQVGAPPPAPGRKWLLPAVIISLVVGAIVVTRRKK